MERTPDHYPSHPPQRHEPLVSISQEKLDATFKHADSDTIAELLTQQIRQGALEALATGTPLDDRVARMIGYSAQAFANPGHIPRLRRFVDTGAASYAELQEALAPIPRRVRAEMQILIDSLGSYLFHRERAQTAPPFDRVMEGAMVYFDTLPDGRRVSIGFAAPERFGPVAFENVARNLSDLIAQHGDAFRAYLRLPGVDVLDTYLVEQFQARSLGPIADAEAETLTAEEVASGTTWDAVEVDGVLHAFRIPSQAKTERGDA